MCRALKEEYGFDIQYFDESSLMYQDVITGNTVACFEDQPVMAYGISQGNGLKIVAEEKENFSTPYGFAVLKGQNAELLEMFNAGLRTSKKTELTTRLLQNILPLNNEKDDS